MQWHKSYETGNKVVDNDHKEIFDMVNKLINISFQNQRENYTSTIDYLSKYVLRHFANEEGIMDESDYPRSEEHKRQHSDFVKVVTQLRERLDANESDIGLEINQTIVDWLSDHVLGSDKALADHYRAWQN